MKPILISGLVNIETTVPITGFPIEYHPIEYLFGGIESNVAGVGFNISAALKALGAEPCFWSVIGQDMNSQIIQGELRARKINCELFPAVNCAAHSVVLYDGTGARMIYCDLKDMQESRYPAEQVQSNLPDTDLAAVCNINFSRALLKPLRDKGVCIATDVHVLSDIADAYNAEFIEAADILFLSNENIIGREHEFINSLAQAYDNSVIVIGMGGDGALMYERKTDKISHYPARRTRDIVNTIGAGDALFSCFLYFYQKTKDPYASLENAMVFASWKIGEKGAAKGFLSEQELKNIEPLS